MAVRVAEAVTLAGQPCHHSMQGWPDFALTDHRLVARCGRSIIGACEIAHRTAVSAAGTVYPDMASLHGLSLRAETIARTLAVRFLRLMRWMTQPERMRI